jgi:hypothetical protein
MTRENVDRKDDIDEIGLINGRYISWIYAWIKRGRE